MRPSLYIFDRISRSTRDFWITAFLGVTLCLVAIYLDAFEQFASLAKVHETWQVDEIATALVFVGLPPGGDGFFLSSYHRPPRRLVQHHCSGTCVSGFWYLRVWWPWRGRTAEPTGASMPPARQF